MMDPLTGLTDEQIETSWRVHTIDAYKDPENPGDWLPCAACGVRPRVWVFDNGRYAKCWCSDLYGLPQAEAEGICTHMRANGGSILNYDRDALRKAWNARQAACSALERWA